MFVNYGRVEDYHTLENKTSLNVSGKIVLCRYGKIFRGDQVREQFHICSLVISCLGHFLTACINLRTKQLTYCLNLHRS